MLFFGGFFFCLWGRGLATLLLFLLRYGRSGEEVCTGYAMAASGRMQYDYKQTNKATDCGHVIIMTLEHIRGG